MQKHSGSRRFSPWTPIAKKINNNIDMRFRICIYNFSWRNCFFHSFWFTRKKNINENVTVFLDRWIFRCIAISCVSMLCLSMLLLFFFIRLCVASSMLFSLFFYFIFAISEWIIFGGSCSGSRYWCVSGQCNVCFLCECCRFWCVCAAFFVDFARLNCVFSALLSRQ